MGGNDDWAELNRAITARSFNTATLRQLRRWFKAANAQSGIPPALLDNLQQLISRRESTRTMRWTVFGAVSAFIAAVASALALGVMLRPPH